MSSEKSSWPGVSSRLKTRPSYSKVITEVTTEMPRSRSISIQSERVCTRFSLRLDLAGELDGAAEQQQLFGQRGLAGVRVRDDREGAAAGDRLGRSRLALMHVHGGSGQQDYDFLALRERAGSSTSS